MNDKKSFVLYHDMRQPLQLLTDEQRGKLLLALMDYSEFGQLPSFTDSGLSMAFTFIRQTLDRDAAAWEDVRRKRAEAGRKGAEVTNGKRRQESANVGNAESSTAKSAVNVTDNVNVTDSGICISADKPRKQTTFVPPTVEQIKKYAAEQGFSMDTDKFVAYYQMRGWSVNGTTITDWKAAVDYWARNNKNGNTQTEYHFGGEYSL